MQTHPATQQTRSWRAGFTLVELLVVIAIIAVLVTVSAGAIFKMRERAKSVVSANNLRQWGSALVLYTGDNNGAIPYEGDGDRVSWASIANTDNETSWFNVLPPYVGQKPMRELSNTDRENRIKDWGIHTCPLVKWRDSRRPTFSYMMNSQIYSSDGPSNNPASSVRLANIEDMSAMVVFADLNQTYNDRPRGRGRHVDDRQPGGKVHLVFFDGSLRSYDASYIRPDNFSGGGVSYTENNKPDIIWNPWIHPRNLRR